MPRVALMELLFRGVNEEIYRARGNSLIPKNGNKPFPRYAYMGDPHAMCGSGIECGQSLKNTVIGHQWNQNGIGTSGISTTPHFERAKFYALCNGTYNIGFVLKLSVPAIRDSGVSMYRVNDLVPFPAAPEDDECILVAKDFGAIPEIVIVEIETVFSSA